MFFIINFTQTMYQNEKRIRFILDRYIVLGKSRNKLYISYYGTCEFF